MKNPVASVAHLEKHTGALLQFAVDELWGNFGKRKRAMQNIYEYPMSKLCIKDSEKMPKTISFPRVLKSFLPSDLVDDIVSYWRSEYKNFEVNFKS